MPQEFGLKWNPFQKLSNLRKTVTLPVFTAACGKTKTCLAFSEETVATTAFSFVAGIDIRSAFSFECWFKTASLYSFSNKATLLSFLCNDGVNTEEVLLSLDTGKLKFSWNKGSGATQTLTANADYSLDTWNHALVTYDGTTIKLYLNTVLVGSVAAASPLINSTAGQTLFLYLGRTGSATKQLVGRLDHICVYNRALVDWEIPALWKRYRGNDAGLLFNIPIKETGNNVQIYNIASGVPSVSFTQPGSSVLVADGGPIGYGASFIAATMAITSTNEYSIKFPVSRPSSANFALCISGYSSSGVFFRYILWNHPSITTLPSDAVAYKGQKLPLTATLEFWNIDGEDNITLASALNLELSLLTLPSNSADRAQVSLGTLTKNSALAQNFPAAWPLTFNTQQTY